ncbi:MAG: O-antigen ligase family protein, partial [Acidimicrobiales bacterium]
QHLSITDWGTDFGQFQFFLIYRAVRTSLRTPAERRLAVWVLLGATVPVAGLAVLQQLHVGPVVSFLTKITGGLSGPNVTAGSSLGASSRATGPFNNWAILAGYLLPLLLVLCALTLSGQIARHRRAAWAIGVIAFTGLLLTAELSAIIVLAIGVFVLARQYGHGQRARRFAGIAVIVAVLIAAPFLGARLNTEFSSSAGSGRHAGVPQTLDFRWQVWSTQYGPAIEARPLTGYGQQMPSTIEWPYPESQYISFLMEGGFPLLVLFGALAWAMLRRSRAASAAEDPFDRAVGRATTVTVVAVLVMNLIWPFLSNAGMPQVLWCLLAIAVPRSDRTREQVAESSSTLMYVGGAQ